MLLPSVFYSVLLSFLGSFDQPTTLVTHLCASPGQLIEFNKFLFDRRPTLIRHLHSLSQLNEVRENEVLVVVNLSCRGLQAELMDEINYKKLNVNYRWLFVDLVDIHDSEQKALNFFYDIPILTSSEIHFCNIKDEDTFEIKRIYRNSKETPLIIEAIYEGSLSSSSITKWTRKDPSTAVARILPPGLSQAPLRATMSLINNDSYNHLTDYFDPHVDAFGKVGFVMNLELIRVLNASVIYSRTIGWGYANNVTGEYNGMAGQLIRNEAELAANLWFANSLRNSHLQFINMACPMRLSILFQAPKLTTTDNVFLLPFHWKVWVALVVMVVVLIPALKLSLFAEEKRWKALNRESHQSRTDWNEVSTVIIGSTCQQGYEANYFSASARLVLLIALLGLLLIHTSFSAHIIGLIQSPSPRIKTLKDLVDSRLSVAYQNTDYNRFYFSNEMEPMRRKLYLTKIHKKKNGEDNAYDMQEGVELIRQGQFAFQAELGVAFKYVANTYQEHEKCNLQDIEYYNSKGLWYAIRKNSTLRRIVTITMFRLREHGIQHRENSLILSKKPVCDGLSGSFLSIGLVDVAPAFLFLFWGFLIAVIVWLGEIIVHYVAKKNR